MKYSGASKKKAKRIVHHARTGTRTRVTCLGSMYANLYTIRAVVM